ncbi:MAG: DUF756 domain-containing protein, partial [Chitinophagaceae bacterium]|nr:DUF756 domain-containing protein [Chitinophagaceae bacterium]
VNSEVFDHTSHIQFLETFLSKKYNKKIEEPNISSWRRTVCGDLTSVFRPYNGEKINQPEHVMHDAFVESIHKAKFKNPPSNFKMMSPGEIMATNKDPRASRFVPDQEKGIRNSNALPYEIYADGKLSADKRSFEITLKCDNRILGEKAGGAPFQIYTPGLYKNEPVHVRSYAIAATDTLKDSWDIKDFDNNNYHLRVYGPNGFYREFKGGTGDPELSVNGDCDKSSGNLVLQINNTGMQRIDITDHAYKGRKKELLVTNTASVAIDVSASYGWYDVSVTLKDYPSFEQRFAGRVETGKPSKTDPFMGRV